MKINPCLTFISVINWFSIAFKRLQVDDSAIFVSWGVSGPQSSKNVVCKAVADLASFQKASILPPSHFIPKQTIEAFVGVESGLLDLHSGRLHATFRVRIPEGAGLVSPCLLLLSFLSIVSIISIAI